MSIHVLEYRIHNLNGGKKKKYIELLRYFSNLMFSLSGDSGDQWRMGAVNVNLGAEFYFIIEGISS